MADLLERLKTLLQNQEEEKLLVEIKKPENHEKVKDLTWDLVTLIGEQLEQTGTESCCQKFLMELAKVCKPKELLIAILEQTDIFKMHIGKFSVFLNPIQSVLLQLPGKRGHSLNWVLNSLIEHVKVLPIPTDNANLQGEEKCLEELDEDYQNIKEWLTCFVPFLKPFIIEISWKNSTANNTHVYVDRIQLQRCLLCKTILKLFDHPLTFLNLEAPPASKPKSSIRIQAEILVKYITDLEKNLLKFISFLQIDSFTSRGYDDYDDDQNDQITELSLGTLYYLIFSEFVCRDSVPYVYSNIQILKFCLPLIDSLLAKTESGAIYKGLTLFDNLIANVTESSLTDDEFNLRDCICLIYKLNSVAIYCSVMQLRQMTIQILTKFLWLFDCHSRYLLLKGLFLMCKHSGVISVLIDVVKRSIIQNVSNIAQEQPSAKWFTGSKLKDLLTKFIMVLPESVETNLLDHWDHIMAALNLLRYLVLLTTDLSGIWDYVSDLERGFLKPLRTSLDLSRAHFQLELNNQNTASSEPALLANTSVSVEGLLLPNVPIEQRVRIIQNALSSFDLMESVYTRVLEIIESHNL